MKDRLLVSAFDWQSWSVMSRHLRVLLLNWHTALVPPLAEPIVLLLAFGIGLGRQMQELTWNGEAIDYLTFLAPGMLAYTAFMMSFFQSLFSAYMRMHYQRTWEGQLTTQIRLEHVIWGEALWAAALATFYATVVCLVLAGFGLAGMLSLHWVWMPAAIPVLFLAALGFASVGLFFTSILPSMDHMGLPFFLVIMPIAFASSTYFPLPDVEWMHAVAKVNPLYHLAEGVRSLLFLGKWTWHLAASPLFSLALILVFLPVDRRLIKKRIFGD